MVRLAIGVIFINLFVYLLVGLALYQIRQQYEKQMALSTQNLAQSLAINVSGILDKIDVALFTMVNETEWQLVDGGINGKSLNAYIARQHSRFPELQGMRMTDDAGDILYGTGISAGNPVNIADREYFRSLYENPDAGLVISKPLISRVSGIWSLIIARRVNNPDGSFAGAAYGVISLEYFTTLFTSIDIGTHGLIEMHDEGLASIVPYPETEATGSSSGKNCLSGPDTDPIRANPQSGTYTATLKDTIERTVSYRKIVPYPLYIIVGRSAIDYLAPWHKEVAVALTLLALFTLVTIFFSSLVITKRSNEMLSMAELANVRTMYEAAFEQTPVPMVLVSMPDTILRIANTACREILGIMDEPTPVGKRLVDFKPSYQDYDADGHLTPLDEAPLARVILREQSTINEERRIVTKDGTTHWALVSGNSIYNTHGNLIAAHLTFPDITESKRAAEVLRESEETFCNIVQANPMGIYLYQLQSDDRLIFIGANPAADKLVGVDNSQFIGKTLEEAFPPLKHTEIPFRYRRAAQHGESWNTELINYADGKISGAFDVHVFQMSPGKIAVLFNEISERKRAEAEQEKLREQLSQVQKMESVGQLAGGVAHDFNNMLGVIIGYAELALDQLDPTQPLFKNLKEIHKAANRSADITRQLLAFARKQTVAPKVLDLNETVEGMLKMLRRLIGEDINLAWLPGAGLWPVKIDPSQIDQIMANLCVNARDAIAGVGKMTVETGISTFNEEYCDDHADVVAGEYVSISVSDDGHGMDKETLAHIFEPFFTTKGVGEGTGLGLATVYGAVKQNNGFINAYSEPGQGTTFTIYLPRYIGEAEQMRQEGAEEPVAHGNETILLVEDEPTILEMTTTMLRRLGYTVLAASTPGEAIRLAADFTDQIHLLATDVIMPEMNGRDLAEQLKESQPGMKCLFMSGYTADIIARQGMLVEGVCFIQKPFSKKDLAAKVREALESKMSVPGISNSTLVENNG